MLLALTFTTALLARSQDTLLLCGREQVVQVSIEKSGDQNSIKTHWDWSAKTSKGLPAAMVEKFRTTDECKPVSQGREILVSSSGGAIALVSRQTGDTLFYANVINAHSVALLPNGLIAAASSTSPTGKGERVLLFDRDQSDKAIASIQLKSAHGVEWDSKRQVLWALGFDEILRVDVSARIGDPEMKILERIKLPSTGGHDLQLSLDQSILYVTNTTQVFSFDPDSKKFTPFPLLADKKNIKSLSFNPKTKQIAYTQADGKEWWTSTLRFLTPEATVGLPDHIYKVRWYRK